jgi:hypothetical protein
MVVDEIAAPRTLGADRFRDFQFAASEEHHLWLCAWIPGEGRGPVMRAGAFT